MKAPNFYIGHSKRKLTEDFNEIIKDFILKKGGDIIAVGGTPMFRMF